MTTATLGSDRADPTATWLATAERVASEIAADAADHDRTGTFVMDGMELVRDRGLVSMLVPAELGGGGATHAEACAALAALAHGCPATALTLSMHTHLVAAQVWRYKHDLPAPVLSRVADERIILVSTGAADWVDSHGTATTVEGGFRVSARKAPASGAPAGDVLVSSARRDGPEGAQVIHFAVPFSAEGISIDETWDTMGMRGTGSHTVVLDEVFVPDDAVSLTRPSGVWHPVWNTVIGAAMPLIMAVYVGIAEAATEQAVALAGQRADVDVAAPLLGRMHNELGIAQDALAAMLVLSDDLAFANTDELASNILSRKTVIADAAISTVRLAMEAVGGAGYSRSVGLERLYRDVHGALYHPLPGAKQAVFTGRVALGLSPLA
jgi:alkylation response protein AidB-like acyl-CoA dehydrogenase